MCVSGPNWRRDMDTCLVPTLIGFIVIALTVYFFKEQP